MRKLIFILIALISFSQAQTIQYIGAPTTTVISRGNFKTDSIFYLPKRTKTPTDTAAFRYQISDSSLYYWTGYQWTKVQSASSFASVDTTIISTRLWRQKGIDSVQYNVGLKVNISDTSTMLSPYIRHAGYGLTKSGQALIVDTLNIATKAYRQKGDDSLGAIIATKGIGTVTSVATGYGLSGGTITTTGTLIADTALIASRLRLGKVADSLSLVKQNVLTNPVTGTGTTNYVPKFTGTSTIGNSSIIDNGSQIITNLTDIRFGNAVSTADVSLKLGRTRTNNGFVFIDLIGDTTYSDYGLRFIRGNTGLNATSSLEHRGTGTFTINANESANVRINTSATERFTILSTGNIGIGNTNPTSILTVGSNNSASTTPTSIEMDRSYRTGGSAFDKLKFYLYKDGTQSYGFGLGDLADVQYWAGSSSTGMHRFFTSQTERARITSSGELLINTSTDAGAYTLQNNGALYNTGSTILAATSGGVTMGSTAAPLSELDIYGTTSLAFTGFRAQQLIYSTEAYNTTPNASIGFVNKFTSGGGYGTLGSISVGKENTTDGNASGYMSFYTYGPSALTEKMRINSSGETLFGTTTDAGNYRVQVSGNAYVTGSSILAATSGSVGIGISSPARTLHIYKVGVDNEVYLESDASTQAAYYLKNLGNAIYMPSGSTDQMRFFVNSADRVIINGSGIVGVNTTSPSASAQLDVSSTTRGFLPPRMTTTQRDAISSPAAGLVIYNTTTSKLQVYTTSWTDLH